MKKFGLIVQGTVLAVAVMGPVAMTALPASASIAAASSSVSDVETWQEPPAYTFTLSMDCTRGGGQWEGIYVVDGAIRYVPATGGQLPSYLPTLGELLTQALAAQAAGLEVELTTDPVDGHPTFAGFNMSQQATDRAVCYRISDYRVGTSTPPPPQPVDPGPGSVPTSPAN
jgi:hypothetical protein